MRIATAAAAALLLSLPLSAFSAESEHGSRAAWTPCAAYEPLETQLRYVEALLDRELAELAAAELARVDVGALDGASEANVGLYGVDSVRAIIENAKLASAEGRAQAASELAALREKTPNAGLRKGACAEAVAYELAYVRAFYTLGDLAARTAALSSETDREEAQDGAAVSDEAAQYLTTAASCAQSAVETLAGDQARPFLFWYAESVLANASDDKRFDKAEKCAAALEKSSKKRLDEYYFYAGLVLVQSARERGQLDHASELIADMLAAFKGAADSPNLPSEIAVGLLAEETRLLAAEGKEQEALKTAAQNVDLLDSPLPENLGRYVDELPDLFEERDLASAEIFWEGAKNAPDESEQETISNVPTKQALTEAAKLASSTARGNAARTRVAILAQRAGATTSDWTTLEAAASESYRNGEVAEALAGYDKASEEAAASGNADDSYRLRTIAAGIVDKICRDKLYESMEDKSPESWETNAKERFEALAKERPADKLAPSFYLLALEHAQKAGDDDQALDSAKLEYLSLFPEAQGTAAFALELARKFVSEERYDDASTALERVKPGDAEFPDAMTLARQIYDAQPTEKRDFIATEARLLDLTSFAAEGGVKSLANLSTRLQESAKRITKDSVTSDDSKILETLFDLALADDARLDAEFASALDAALDRWEQAVPEESGKIQAYRLTLALDTKSPDELVALLKSTNGANSDAALDALERILASAEGADAKKRKQLAQFALDSLGALEKTAANGPRIDLLRADALRMVGKTQESLNLYAALRKKDAKNARAVKGIATLLTAQKDAKTLEQALKYWSDYADLTPTGSHEWWDAKERCIEIYCRLGKKDQAEKTLKTLWLTRSDPTDPGRKARWEKMVRK